MEYFAGLDVSLDTISICIVNADGDILLEKKIEADPAAIIAVLKHFGGPLKRIGLEAGPTSSWLYSELRGAGYAVICLECRHVKAGLSAMRNKTDRNDARGIAQLVRLGWFRQVHVKSEAEPPAGPAANLHIPFLGQLPPPQLPLGDAPRRVRWR